jgi:hypothetical protein
VFRWVQNKDASNALALGQIAFHKFSDGADADKYVYQCLAANLAYMAGIVVGTDGLAAYTATSKCFGWVQIFGYTPTISIANASGTAYAAGASCIGVDQASYLTWGAASGTAPLYKRQVILMEAVATVTTTLITAVAKKGFVSCL